MSRFIVILCLLCLVAAAGCDQAEKSNPVAPPFPPVDLKPSFRLSSNTREAVVLEARYALRPQIWGPYKSLNGNAVGEWRYIIDDSNAWKVVTGWYKKALCSLMYVSGRLIFWTDPYLYALYGGYGRGGQCVFFANLVIYRSGVYRNNAIPSYNTCRQDFESSSPKFTKPASKVRPGDILRTKRGVSDHTAIAVAVLSGTPGSSVTSVDVIDSNFIGTEIIGMHALKTANSGLADLDNYFAVDLIKMGAR